MAFLLLVAALLGVVCTELSALCMSMFLGDPRLARSSQGRGRLRWQVAVTWDVMLEHLPRWF